MFPNAFGGLFWKIHRKAPSVPSTVHHDRAHLLVLCAPAGRCIAPYIQVIWLAENEISRNWWWRWWSGLNGATTLMVMCRPYRRRCIERGRLVVGTHTTSCQIDPTKQYLLWLATWNLCWFVSNVISVITWDQKLNSVFVMELQNCFTSWPPYLVCLKITCSITSYILWKIGSFRKICVFLHQPVKHNISYTLRIIGEYNSQGVRYIVLDRLMEEDAYLPKAADFS